MKFEDMAEFELRIQLDRLSYIDALLKRKTYCDFPPRKIYIEPTNICNLKCVHCVHNGALTRPAGHMSLGSYKGMIEQIKPLRLHTKIQFTGVGEPFINKNLFDMIKYASDYGFFTLMNTNATILTKERAEKLIDSGLDYLHVSIDGITRESYESIRIGGDFYKVIENIFTLFEARYEKKGYHLAVILGIINQRRNQKEVQLFTEYFERFPFHHVVVGELFNHMGAIDEANIAYMGKKAIQQKDYPACNTPWDLLSFNCDGSAVGCNYDFDNRYVIGNFTEDKVLDIWNSEKMQYFRKCVLEREYGEIEKNGPLCSTCTIKWQKTYQIPTGFHEEVARMEDYLVRAVKRTAFHRTRNEEFRGKEEYILSNRDSLIKELNNLDNACKTLQPLNLNG
ncbi:radical SAM protein [Candidatus Magnetominusculus xianensis]|uniref:Radical SAM protein n=1 Tax=Candidatus Magnetominusculus xianensis TaxID=1748249 RepID=A0ABR5SIJ1_9BACT|nr:radical SAM/SPASM domain-containing protein [Candidatus Magnetominusculus xianensis]KWT91556.1 radical SAM protein [Candidatus Magnetominusculus xianensis]MBF0404342.1 radical SAM protein [Nitrospirota bacterium]